MIQEITVEPFEQGTAIVTITLTDEASTALVFTDLTNPQWQLMKESGSVVNNRTFALSSMTSLQFVLSGDDLAIFGTSDRGNRVISFQADYDGSLDDGTTFTGTVIAEGKFNIQKVLGQVDDLS
jgi:hypothetical protein